MIQNINYFHIEKEFENVWKCRPFCFGLGVVVSEQKHSDKRGVEAHHESDIAVVTVEWSWKTLYIYLTRKIVSEA